MTDKQPPQQRFALWANQASPDELEMIACYVDEAMERVGNKGLAFHWTDEDWFEFETIAASAIWGGILTGRASSKNQEGQNTTR